MKHLAARPIPIPIPISIAADQRSGPALAISHLLPGYPAQEAEEFRGDIFIAPQRFPLSPTRRLVVLVPDGGLDENALARKVWRLASTSALFVLFLGLSPDQESVPLIRRRLALLAAVIHQGEVSTGTGVVVGENWNRGLQKVLRNGDLLICVARQKVRYYAIWRRGLGESLAAAFNVPVYMLGGLKVSRSPVQLQRARSIFTWCLSIAILLAFGGLQIWISQNASAQLSPVLLCLSIIAEGITLFKTIEWIG